MAKKTAAQYLATADAEYVGDGIWRIDLSDELALTVDVEAAEATPRDDVRALALAAVQAIIGETAEAAK